MANLKSSLKDIRRIAKRTEQNRTVKSRLKTLRKKVLGLEPGTTDDSAKSVVNTYCSALDKATKSGVIHKNKANRQKSIAQRKLQPAATEA